MMAESRTMSCRESGKYDNASGAKQRLTGWGRICIDRRDKPFTRRMRVLRNKERKVN